MERLALHAQQNQLACSMQWVNLFDKVTFVCVIVKVFMRLDSRKSGQININQMKKFYIASEDDTLWSQMLDIFGLNGNHTSISFAVSSSLKCNLQV